VLSIAIGLRFPSRFFRSDSIYLSTEWAPAVLYTVREAGHCDMAEARLDFPPLARIPPIFKASDSCGAIPSWLQPNYTIFGFLS